jgi:hypothetical protein
MTSVLEQLNAERRLYQMNQQDLKSLGLDDIQPTWRRSKSYLNETESSVAKKRPDFVGKLIDKEQKSAIKVLLAWVNAVPLNR